METRSATSRSSRNGSANTCAFANAVIDGEIACVDRGDIHPLGQQNAGARRYIHRFQPSSVFPMLDSLFEFEIRRSFEVSVILVLDGRPIKLPVAHAPH